MVKNDCSAEPCSTSLDRPGTAVPIHVAAHEIRGAVGAVLIGAVEERTQYGAEFLSTSK